MTKLHLSLIVVAITATGAFSKDYNLQSAFPKGLPILGPGADRFVATVSTLTDGEIQFKHLGAGELSPPTEILENVGSGAIDAAWSYAAYAAGSQSAAALFGSIPFGPDAMKYVSWIHHGGGLELWREAYRDFNVVPMPCGVIISEAGGWFTKPINSPDDLKGLNFRIGGIGGKILAKLGVNAMSLPVGEVSTSLETGRLDATELSFPMIDKLLGFDKVAKHYYFPGWHQPSGFIEFYMNKDAWDALSNAQRRAIEVSCADVNLWAIGEASAAQASALQAFRENGVEVKRFPNSVMDALRQASQEVYAEESKDNLLFKKVMESYDSYSAKYDEYRNLNSID